MSEKSPEKRLKWTPTIQVRAGLNRLEVMGLYGDSLSHIVNHIVTEEITRLLESGLITREALDMARRVVEEEWGKPDRSED